MVSIVWIDCPPLKFVVEIQMHFTNTFKNKLTTGLKINFLNRGSYMSAHVLLNLLNELGKRDKLRAFYFFSATSLINSIKQEHEC